MKNYILITGTDDNIFEKDVNTFIEEGYKPLGQVVVTEISDWDRDDEIGRIPLYSTAMVKDPLIPDDTIQIDLKVLKTISSDMAISINNLRLLKTATPIRLLDAAVTELKNTLDSLQNIIKAKE